MATRIKNWNKFQHFKDRRPPWIKLYRDLLDDCEWFALSAPAAKTLISLWLIASENDGALPPIKSVAFRLRQTEEETLRQYSALSHWLDGDDINMISSRYQDDIKVISQRYQLDTPETEKEKETETEGETEERHNRTRVSALLSDFCQQVGAMFRRRPSTAWADKEMVAARKLCAGNPDIMADVAEIAKARALHWQYYRRDVQTLLNNWPAEVDRAREYLANPRDADGNLMTSLDIVHADTMAEAASAERAKREKQRRPLTAEDEAKFQAELAMAMKDL